VSLSRDEIRDIFQRTVIVRRPTYGIVRGYHELPYICLGQSNQPGARTTSVRGKIRVSPQFVIKPSHYHPDYGKIFGEDNVDAALSGRMFGFLGFPDKPVECSSEYLNIEYLDASVDKVLSDSIDELERKEDITTGVIITPSSRYYPVSVERFITTILDDEFSF